MRTTDEILEDMDRLRQELRELLRVQAFSVLNVPLDDGTITLEEFQRMMVGRPRVNR
jgi:hypothetical protein